MIDINRHNYETFFLLYTDNELSVEEKNVVDDFVGANPDLQEELVMLQQSILKPDHIIFADKLSLHKEDLIPTQLQEKLLLYLDKELNANERNELDGLIKTDTDIELEWSILQQTKFSTTEVVIFDDKESLYKKEGGRLVGFSWRRLAAAAILIGFGVWGGLVYLNSEKKIENKEMAKSTPAKINVSDSVNADKEVVVADIVEKITNTTTTMVIIKKSSTEILKKSAAKNLPATLSPGDKMEIVTTKKSNNLPKPYFENVNNNGSNISVTANVQPQNTINSIVNPGNNVIEKIETKKEATAITFASTASFVESGEQNNNRFLYMDEEQVKKTKLGGIFRKVKRVLERNANIKSGGNHIKVANLEFAIQ